MSAAGLGDRCRSQPGGPIKHYNPKVPDHGPIESARLAELVCGNLFRRSYIRLEQHDADGALFGIVDIAGKAARKAFGLGLFGFNTAAGIAW